MSRWGELAEWVGPTVNQGGPLKVHRGLVVHIAEGFYGGTISWQKNPASDVSSHFIVGRDGRLAQMVDTDREAWTQRAGNAAWLSVECEGFTTGNRLHRPGWEALTSQQIDRVAQLLARAHQQYGVPFQLATGPDSAGLGYHSMGGAAWGHQACPGTPIIGQRGEIIARARSIAGLPDTTPPPHPAAGDWTRRLVTMLPTLTLGAHGQAVKREQALLNVVGARLAEDGDHGPATDSAVKAFQRTNHLAVDGVTGPKTWTKLLGE